MTLDQLFHLWVKDGSEQALDNLMKQVIRTVKNLTQDDDIAQEVAITIFNKLDSFKPQDPKAFARYVSSITKNHRLKSAYARSYDSTDVDDWQEPTPDRSSFISLSGLGDFHRQVATAILQGYSLKEIAGQMNLKESTLRKKLFDIRNEMSLSKDI